jgi:Mg2+-importing ATPase
MNPHAVGFWGVPVADLLRELGSSPEGLASAEAERRLLGGGAHRLEPRRRTDSVTLLLAQFKSPLILILLFASGLSFFVRDPSGAVIILAIVLVSGLLGFWQENGAAQALSKLLSIVETKASALRDGEPREIPVDQLVPGDVIALSPGASIPGDCLLLSALDLYVDEATLTG